MPSLRLIAEFNQPSKKIISSNYAMTIIGLSYLGLKPKKQPSGFRKNKQKKQKEYDTKDRN